MRPGEHGHSVPVVIVPAHGYNVSRAHPTTEPAMKPVEPPEPGQPEVLYSREALHRGSFTVARARSRDVRAVNLWAVFSSTSAWNGSTSSIETQAVMVEYVDFAEYYDHDHVFTEDIGFYLDWACRCDGPILELGCGTGRVTLPLAEHGFRIHGVDVSANMLSICRDRVVEKDLDGRVELCLADMAGFDLLRNDFSLAFAALRSFMHLQTQAEQLACLRRVYSHLRPGGHFIVDVIAPDLEQLSRKPNGQFVIRREFDLPNGHHVLRKQRLVEHDVVGQVRHFEFLFEEFDAGGALVRERLVPLYMRYTFRYELQLLLERVGFEIVESFRDYEQSPYDGTGDMILVSRRTR